MTTEQPIVGGEEPEEAPEQDANAELRAAYKRLKDENKDLRTDALHTHLGTIGLQTDAGLGKAIAKEYKGAINADDLATYARDEYGYDSGVTPEVPEEVAAGERLDQALATSVPVEPVATPLPGEEEVNKINSNDSEATRQDAITSIAAKAEQFQKAFPQ